MYSNQNLQVCHEKYGGTSVLHQISSSVYRARKSLRKSDLVYIEQLAPQSDPYRIVYTLRYPPLFKQSSEISKLPNQSLKMQTKPQLIHKINASQKSLNVHWIERRWIEIVYPLIFDFLASQFSCRLVDFFPSPT